MKFVVIVLALLASISIYAVQTVEININAKNDQNQLPTAPLSFGVSPLATDNLDTELGELLLPPPPVLGFYIAFEFIDSTQINEDSTKYYDRIWTNKDLRAFPEGAASFYIRHKLIIKYGLGTKATLSWNNLNIPSVIDSLYLMDPFNGLVIKVNMKEQNSIEIENNISSLFIHAYYKAATDITEDTYEDQISISPNPAGEFLNIANGGKIMKIEITDYLGNIINEYTAPPQRIAVNYLPSGIYFIRFYEKEKFTVRKFIKN